MKWPRVVECCLAVWLALSPFVFDHVESPWLLWDLGAAALVALLSMLSLWSPAKRAHLGLALVAGAMLVHALLVPDAHVPAAQNHIVVALLVLMLAVIPTEAVDPPEGWREPPV